MSKRKIKAGLFVFVLLAVAMIGMFGMEATATLQDLTTFTQVGSEYLTVNATTITLHANRNWTAYAYKDYGVDYFDNFYITFSAKSDFSDDYCWASALMLSNYVGDLGAHINNNQPVISIDFHWLNEKNNCIQLRWFDGTTSTINELTNITANTFYYFNLTKSSTTLTLKIYSDSAMTNLIDTFTIDNVSFTPRYLYATATYNNGVGDREQNITVANININLATGNTPPSCSLSSSPTEGEAPLTVTFSMTANDDDGSIVSWKLDIDNDGTAEYSGSGSPPATQEHTYSSAGNYTAKLTVTDDDGATASDTVAIRVLEVVSDPPSIINPSPANGTTITTPSPECSVTVMDDDTSSISVSFYDYTKITFNIEVIENINQQITTPVTVNIQGVATTEDDKYYYETRTSSGNAYLYKFYKSNNTIADYTDIYSIVGHASACHIPQGINNTTMDSVFNASKYIYVFSIWDWQGEHQSALVSRFWKSNMTYAGWQKFINASNTTALEAAFKIGNYWYVGYAGLGDNSGVIRKYYEDATGEWHFIAEYWINSNINGLDYFGDFYNGRWQYFIACSEHEDSYGGDLRIYFANFSLNNDSNDEFTFLQEFSGSVDEFGQGICAVAHSGHNMWICNRVDYNGNSIIKIRDLNLWQYETTQTIASGNTASFDYVDADTDGRWYWKVTADDGYNNVSKTYYFILTAPEPNDPPDTPNNPSPANGATNVSVTIDLSWTCSDPNGDALAFDVYFGTSAPPQKVASNISATTYDPGTLDYNTTYYWKIVAWDSNGASTSSSVWSFTTAANESTTNNPPIADFSYTVENLTVTFTDESTDSDGSIVNWTWNFGDGGTSTLQNPTHTYASEGTYTVTLSVTDDDGATDSVSYSITVTEDDGGGGIITGSNNSIWMIALLAMFGVLAMAMIVFAGRR